MPMIEKCFPDGVGGFEMRLVSYDDWKTTNPDDATLSPPIVDDDGNCFDCVEERHCRGWIIECRCSCGAESRNEEP